MRTLRWAGCGLLLLLTGCSRTIVAPAEPSHLPRNYPSGKEIQRVIAPTPLKKTLPLLVIIDPGHGGKDPGARSRSKPVQEEKQLALATAKFVQTYLQQLGMRTQLTRSGDTFLELTERVAFAKKARGDLFVSVHYNSTPDPETAAQGVEVFYYQSDKDTKRTLQSKALGQEVLKQILSHTKSKSRGLKHGNYHVIRETGMPSILVEGGFLNNAQEAARIRQTSFQKELAWGIARGIVDYTTHQQKK